MVLPAATASTSKRKQYNWLASDSDDNSDFEEGDSDLCNIDNGSDSEGSIIEDDEGSGVLRATWKSKSPPELQRNQS